SKRTASSSESTPMKLCTTCWLTFKRCVEHPPRRKRRGFLRPLGLFFRDGFGGFLPQPPYFSGGPRRGFTFGLPAHRSFGQRMESSSGEKEGPYILGLKTPRLYGPPGKACFFSIGRVSVVADFL